MEYALPICYDKIKATIFTERSNNKIMEKDKYGHNVNKYGVEFKASTSSSGKDKIDIYDKCPAENEDHGSIHINFDSNVGKGTITDTTNGTSETTHIGCYLTTACIEHLQDKFDDNCNELTTLRWFRDNFVSKEDIEHYYKVAPIIVQTINKLSNSKDIYNDIYQNIISVCLSAIEHKDYEYAYKKYKDSVLELESKFFVYA